MRILLRDKRHEVLNRAADKGTLGTIPSSLPHPTDHAKSRLNHCASGHIKVYSLLVVQMRHVTEM